MTDVNHEWKVGDRFIVRRSWGLGFETHTATRVTDRMLWERWGNSSRESRYEKDSAYPYSDELWEKVQQIAQEQEEENARHFDVSVALRIRTEELLASVKKEAVNA